MNAKLARCGGDSHSDAVANGGASTDQPIASSAPGKSIPAKRVVQSSPAATGNARVSVPVVTISPATSGA